VTTSRQAHASYGVALALSRREKTFLRGVWPQVGMFAAMGCGIAFGPGRHGSALPLSFAPFALYWLSMIALGVFDLGRFSEHASARWIFDALPAQRTEALIEGGCKALLCGTVLPVLCLAAVASTVIAGSGTGSTECSPSKRRRCSVCAPRRSTRARSRSPSKCGPARGSTAWA